MSTPSMFVDKFYQMDPQFEEVLPDGSHLEEGMVVLLEDPFLRAEPSDPYPYTVNLSLERNRWATVSKLKIHNSYKCDDHGEVEHKISFVAIYGDGSQRMREYSMRIAWLVKIESLYSKEAQEDEKYQAIVKLIREAILTNEESSFTDRRALAKLRAEQVASKIMELNNGR